MFYSYTSAEMVCIVEFLGAGSRDFNFEKGQVKNSRLV
jgi:hypothetical protein